MNAGVSKSFGFERNAVSGKENASEIGSLREKSFRAKYSPFYLLSTIMIALFASEWVVMLILNVMPDMPQEWKSVIDALTLTVLVFPILYFFHYRPNIRDLSELSQLTSVLAESEYRIRTIMDATSDSIVQIDEDGFIVFWNPAAEKLFGYASDEIMNKKFVSLVTSTQYYGFFEKWFHNELSLLQRGAKNFMGQSQIEVFLKPKNGHVIPVEVSLSTVQLQGGVNTICVARDITVRKKAHIALKESEKRFREALEKVKMMTAQIDAAGNVMFCNDYLLKMTGWKKGEVVGHNWFEIFIPEESQAVLQKKHYESVSSGADIPPVEQEIVTRSGDRRVVLCNTSSLLDAKGRVTGITVIGEDITERKRSEAAIKESNERLRRANEELKKAESRLVHSEKLASLGQLAAGVAHEIRNPLNIISTSIQLLSMEDDLSPETMKTTKIVVEQVKRASKITENLREFAREKKPEIKNVDLHNFLDRTIALVEYEMSLENIAIVRSYDSSSIHLLGDEDQLAQVFLNIIGNARDSMNEKQENYSYDELQNKGWKGKLAVETIVEGNMAEVKFKDTGLGVPREKIEKIFDPFFTTKVEGKGTGLGLAIAYGIIENHGGKIEIESEVGENAEFSIYLPLADTGEEGADKKVGSDRV